MGWHPGGRKRKVIWGRGSCPDAYLFSRERSEGDVKARLAQEHNQRDPSTR